MNASGGESLWTESVRVALLYSALTLAFAYPLTLHPATTMLRVGADSNLLLWLIEWDVHAFVHQPLSIFDANIFYPFRHTLAYSENLIGSALFAAPVMWITGNPVLALNVVTLLSCVLCGVGAYMLCRRVGVGPLGACIGGLVFAFAPPRFFRISQPHIAAIQWVPFGLASLHYYLDVGRRRDLWWACGCFALQVLTSGHGAVFFTIAICSLIAWRAVLGEPLRPLTRLGDLGVPGFLLLGLSAAVLMPYLSVQREVGLRRGLGEADFWAPNLASFLASPSHLHMFLLGRFWSASILEDAKAFLFPGYLTLGLAIAAVWPYRGRAQEAPPANPARVRRLGHRLRRWSEMHRRSATGLYALLSLVTLWLALGPRFGLYTLVYSLPGFSFIRVPSRFTLLTLLGLSVLAAIGFERLTNKFERKRAMIAAVAGVALTIEFFVGPFNAVAYHLEIPPADRWLATQPTPFVVAELPTANPGGDGDRRQSVFMLHSTAHWQKTIHGYSGFQPRLLTETYSALTTFPDDNSIRRLLDLRVTYVVIHTGWYPEGAWKTVEARLEQYRSWLTLARVEEQDRVYTLNRPGLH